MVRLKENDDLLTLIREMVISPDFDLPMSLEDALAVVEKYIVDHIDDPENSRLKCLCPNVGRFFCPLSLVDALHLYDKKTHLTKRKFVPPSFKEIRHILDIAQVHASSPHLKLITFDADDTLFDEGANLDEESEMIDLVVQLLRRGLLVSVVTAAGYPNAPDKYETRFRTLLDRFSSHSDFPLLRSRFFIVGGECNYMLKINDEGRLYQLHSEEWQIDRMKKWGKDDIKQMLDTAEATLKELANTLEIEGWQVLRKERAIGMITPVKLEYEMLEEITMVVQKKLEGSPLPYCAFNGGVGGVWIDIGDKKHGIECLQQYLNVKPTQTLHVGDRFTSTGNDFRARDICCTLWIANPSETAYFVRMLCDGMDKAEAKAEVEADAEVVLPPSKREKTA